MDKHDGRAHAALNLQYATGLQLAGDNVQLLEAVAQHGSITGAAQAVGISYRTAWQRIETLNNLATSPLVERASGGAGGGGTRLTSAGQRLLTRFRALETEHQRFLRRLSRHMSAADDTLATLGRMSMQLSARNQFHGRIETIRNGAVNAEINIDVGSGHTIGAIITEDSLARLDLHEGDDALAIIKASSVILTTDTSAATSARNCLAGTISRLQPGAVNTDVVIDLGAGKSVGAIITNTSAEQLGLAEGVAAAALFQAASVILARSA